MNIYKSVFICTPKTNIITVYKIFNFFLKHLNENFQILNFNKSYGTLKGNFEIQPHKLCSVNKSYPSELTIMV